MVKDYAQFLGLNGDELLSLFRRDYNRHLPTKSTPRSLFSLTPQFTFSFFIVLLSLSFVVYLVSEYLKFNRPPPLEVVWPENFSGSSLKISGKTDPQSTVKINDTLVLVDIEGNFTKEIQISTPEAKIVIEAESPAGKVTIDEKVLK